jgi:hypothetical protein
VLLVTGPTVQHIAVSTAGCLFLIPLPYIHQRLLSPPRPQFVWSELIDDDLVSHRCAMFSRPCHSCDSARCPDALSLSVSLLLVAGRCAEPVQPCSLLWPFELCMLSLPGTCRHPAHLLFSPFALLTFFLAIVARTERYSLWQSTLPVLMSMLSRRLD